MKLLFVFLFSTLLFATKPDLVLLKNYTDDTNVSGWFMSEKLDGVRAYWDGEKLISRNGKVFAVPEFFIKDFPTTKLDGELWSKRGDFSNISSIVNKKKPHMGWEKLTYNVFEVPEAEGNLTTRLANVAPSKYIKVIQQVKVENKNHLNEYLKNIEQKSGEGIVVRDGTVTYYTGRKSSALKVKSYIDEECVVSGHIEGKGKYQDMTGALLCKMENKKIIKIGSGLSNKERVDPPQIGAIITFKYYGLTSKGNPRFPIFLRERK